MPVAPATEPAHASRPDEAVAAEPTSEPTPEPTSQRLLEPEAKPPGEMVHVAEGNTQTKAPYYMAAIDAVRKRHGLGAMPGNDTRKVRWRCFIADPLCGFNIEVQAMGAVAGRFKQGDVRTASVRKRERRRAVRRLGEHPGDHRERGPHPLHPHDARAEGLGIPRYGHTWGNVGMVGRDLFGRGALRTDD